MPLIDVPTVHAVTEARILEDSEFLAKAERVFNALGAQGAVHLRAPGGPAAELYRLALALAPLQAATGCWLVVNDRVDVALASGARAAQLAGRSLPLQDARRVLTSLGGSPAASLRFGVSVHSADEATEALRIQAEWVLGGTVFDSASHPGRRGGGGALVRELTATGATVIAIGGVLPSHVSQLKAWGCHGVASVSGIWLADDPGAAAARYL